MLVWGHGSQHYPPLAVRDKRLQMLCRGTVRNEESTREHTSHDIFHAVGRRPSQYILVKYTIRERTDGLSGTPSP